MIIKVSMIIRMNSINYIIFFLYLNINSGFSEKLFIPSPGAANIIKTGVDDNTFAGFQVALICLNC